MCQGFAKNVEKQLRTRSNKFKPDTFWVQFRKSCLRIGECLNRNQSSKVAFTLRRITRRKMVMY